MEEGEGAEEGISCCIWMSPLARVKNTRCPLPLQWSRGVYGGRAMRTEGEGDAGERRRGRAARAEGARKDWGGRRCRGGEGQQVTTEGEEWEVRQGGQKAMGWTENMVEDAERREERLWHRSCSRHWRRAEPSHSRCLVTQGEVPLAEEA